MSKEADILRLLQEGASPTEIVRQGFSRGTTYKVAGKLAKRGTTPPSVASNRQDGYDEEVEQNPEVVELKTQLKKAKLQREIDEIQGNSSWSRRIDQLESRLSDCEENIAVIDAAVSELI